MKNLKTENFFSNLINKNDADYTRYIYFYLGYLVNKNKLEEAKEIISNIDYINSTLLVSQGKNWIENKNFKKFEKIFSCQNHNDIVSEFLFLISNLYSSQDDFKKSKAKQFRGKSAKKKKEMAVAAYLAKQNDE